MVYRVGKILERERRSPFADPLRGIAGSKIEENFELAPAGRCVGTMLVGARLAVPGRQIFRVNGWAWDVERDQPPAYVVMAGSDGIVRGLGYIGRRQGWPGKRREPTGFHWAGVLAAARDQGQRAYGLLSDGRTICALMPREPGV